MSRTWDLNLYDGERALDVGEKNGGLTVEVRHSQAWTWFDLSEEEARKLSDWLLWFLGDAGEPKQ